MHPLVTGSFRNHCPVCLWSVHLDIDPGDRAAGCGGLMWPVRVVARAKGLMVVHRCDRCGAERANRVALDDPVQPDDAAIVGELSASPRW